MFFDATSFNQNISNWCVTNIDSEPTDFSLNSPLSQSNMPVWGTCPNAPTPITDSNFQDAINTCLTTNPVDGLCSNSEYGAMPDWDVSNVTIMQQAFFYKENFNGDISSWNVSSVNDMSKMFFVATSFNQDVGDWDVSNVSDMSDMFGYANTFNQDISSWDVSNVVDMSGMFQFTMSFNQPIGSWDLSSVTNMNGVFGVATSFNQDISCLLYTSPSPRD